MKVLMSIPHYGWIFGLADSMPNDDFYIVNKLSEGDKRVSDLSISNGYWQWLRSIKPKPTNTILLGQSFDEINPDDYDVAILIPDAGQINLWKQYLSKVPIVWKFHLSNPESKAIFNERGTEIIGNYPCIFSAETQREFYGLYGEVAWSQNPEVYKDWNGNIERAMWTCERIGVPKDSRYTQRGGSIWDKIRPYIRGKRYGLDFRLGTPITTFEELLMAYKLNRCYVECATNTILTDGLVEAMMVGMPPVVYANWEMDKIIENGVNGYKTTDSKEMIYYVNHLLEDYDLAKEIGKKARETALKLWNPNVTKEVYHKAFIKAIDCYNSRFGNNKVPKLIDTYRIKRRPYNNILFDITMKRISELEEDFCKEYSNMVECSRCHKKLTITHVKDKHIVKSIDKDDCVEIAR